MKRRDFVQSSLGGLLLSKSIVSDFGSPKSAHTFKHHYAPHFGMFKNHAGEDLVDQLKFMADQGFTGLEDNGLLGRSIQDQEKIGNTLAKLGMKMGVFVIDGGDNWKASLTTGKQEFQDKFLATCQLSVEAAKRVNAQWATVVPGFYNRVTPIGIQTANVVDSLRKGSDILEKSGLIMVLEPLSDTPDLFLRNSDQTFEICKAVDSPSCKILYDIYHMQRNEGNLINSINACWDEIAYFQIGDNPGRKEPTTGEINFKTIFKHIYDKGYRGIMGMEHGNAQEGKAGEIALIEAYKTVDKF